MKSPLNGAKLGCRSGRQPHSMGLSDDVAGRLSASGGKSDAHLEKRADYKHERVTEVQASRGLARARQFVTAITADERRRA